METVRLPRQFRETKRNLEMKLRLIVQAPILVLLLTLSLQIVAGRTSSTSFKLSDPETSSSISSNEASMMLLMRYVHAAEATFQSTTGAGRFGTLRELYLARLIDVRAQTGVSDGYRFILSVSNPVGGPSTFELVAKPQTFMLTGVRTFSINHAGEVRVSYMLNASPSQMHLVTDECGSTGCTEAFARAALRMIHSAEATFQSTVGNGRFGTLEELVQNNLVSTSLATGSVNGYSFFIRVDDGSKTEPASFEALATPSKYPVTGILSYYIDEAGILRGGNRNGLEANSTDDPFCG
jgi:hypothetical protein